MRDFIFFEGDELEVLTAPLVGRDLRYPRIDTNSHNAPQCYTPEERESCADSARIGDRMLSRPREDSVRVYAAIPFRESVECARPCPPLQGRGHGYLRRLIHQGYRLNLWLNGVPLRAAAEMPTTTEGVAHDRGSGVPMGEQVAANSYTVFNHMNFLVHYAPVSSAATQRLHQLCGGGSNHSGGQGYRVVSFTAVPQSMQKPCATDDVKNITLHDDMPCTGITWTYSVTWVSLTATTTTTDDAGLRLFGALGNVALPTFAVVLLLSCVARRADAQLPDSWASFCRALWQTVTLQDRPWRLIKYGIFRPPARFSVVPLVVMVAPGVQLTCTALLMMAALCAHMIVPEDSAGVVSFMVAAFVLLSPVNGCVCYWLLEQWHVDADDSYASTHTSDCLCIAASATVIPAFTIWIVFEVGSPMQLLLELIALWWVGVLPLSFIGAEVTSQMTDVAKRPFLPSRPVPRVSLATVLARVVGRCFFSAPVIVYVAMWCRREALWGLYPWMRNAHQQFSVEEWVANSLQSLVVFMFLTVVDCALQLQPNVGNHRWHLRPILASGFAVIIHVYSIVWAALLHDPIDMDTLVARVVVGYALGSMTSAIGFCTCWVFTSCLYAAIP